ncbi:MAG: T9SS type A sorting domain-containing protein [Bacteroidetes bacterium]|nr:T9SS type A sorting domain-containing protein [Bacteroidota bacterium]
MKSIFKCTLLIGLIWQHTAIGQSVIRAYPDSLVAPINENLTPGVFFCPKTSAASTDFKNNGIRQNNIRTNAIENALNNASNLTNCLSLLAAMETELQSLSLKCNKLIFIFEKMPLWLSSSADGNPVTGIGGYYVFNTKPPANWNNWQTAVDSITSKIVNQFKIPNAYFEIWNEPDLGSWSGTTFEYFTLYKRTFDRIKSANPSAKVGGPTVNFWANNLNWQPPYGYISNAKADSSLISQLLDSAVVWNKIPDFISWHNFNISYQEFGNAANYIQNKLLALSLPNIPLIVSEWNAPSAVRDTRLATSYMIKAQLELSKTIIENNSIAAWQDFNPSTTEFHQDYGLLTYGAIHKPAYNGLLLSEKSSGTTCKMNSSVPYDGISSVINDTLSVLISNYCPPPFVEALNNTLYQGKINIKQLDSAGYLDIAGKNALHLDSIYKGLITIQNSNAMQIAINNSIKIYQHYDSIETSPRQFMLNIDGYTGNYSGQSFIVDSTHNNMQFKYDSLLVAGDTQSSAISKILSNQNINYSTIAVNGGQYSFSLQPNAVCLLKINIPGINSITKNDLHKNSFTIYPNPGSEQLTIVFSSQETKNEQIQFYNSIGDLIKTVDTKRYSTAIDVSELPIGIYFIQLKNDIQQDQKFIKQ